MRNTFLPIPDKLAKIHYMSGPVGWFFGFLALVALLVGFLAWVALMVGWFSGMAGTGPDGWLVSWHVWPCWLFSWHGLPCWLIAFLA